MASTSAVAMAALPLNHGTQKTLPTTTLFKPLLPNHHRRRTAAVQASSTLKDKALVAASFTASIIIPEVAQAATNAGVTPSLNNFLYSIAAGTIVLTAIIGAVLGVSNFDPVKRA